ncbi:hornerin-like [Iris pallida]|uniref:Hornerin-like n=1 Tax=Iris pallida TaxID=29817 RepID=A0AAX6GJD1_IRIPA|nr:hornerin-like [Iris pallida]
MRCRPNELIVASPGAGRPAPRPWTLVQRAYRCRLQRCSATRRLTTRCWKRSNFLVGSARAAAKLTRFVLPRVEPYGSPRGYDSGSVRQPRVRPCRHVSGIGPASLGRLPASVQPTADATAPSVGSRPRRRHPVARAANPIAFGKRPVEYVPSRPFRLVREREGTRTRATRCPRVTALRRLVWTAGHSVRACVGLADAVDAEGLGGDPPPAPTRTVYSTPLSTRPAPPTSLAPRAAGRSRRRRGRATWLILPVVICLSQRLSHACVSMNKFRL